MENITRNALIKDGVYCSKRIPFGGMNGLIMKGTVAVLPGVKICKSGIQSTNVRYSVFVGSIARKGIPFS